MPKLIRLVSDSTKPNSRFITRFNEDLVIKPYGKIGLVSCSLPLSLQHISIDATNNNVLDVNSTNSNAYETVFLRFGFYDSTTFVRELIRACNASLNFITHNASDGGFQHDFEIVDDKINWHIRRGKYETMVIPAANLKGSTAFNAGVLSRAVGTDNYTNFAYTDQNFINSCGCMRATLGSLQTSIFGLAATINDVEMTVAEYKYGIINLPGTYLYISEWCYVSLLSNNSTRDWSSIIHRIE